MHAHACACVQVTVWRGNEVFAQDYARGKPSSELVAASTSGGESGTQVRFRFDTSIFSADAAYDSETIRRRLRELAFLNNAATLKFECSSKGETTRDEFHYSGGIAEYVAHMTAGTEVLHAPIHFQLDSAGLGVRTLETRALGVVAIQCKRIEIDLAQQKLKALRDRFQTVSRPCCIPLVSFLPALSHHAFWPSDWDVAPMHAGAIAILLSHLFGTPLPCLLSHGLLCCFYDMMASFWD